MTFEHEIAVFSPPQPAQDFSSPVTPVSMTRRHSQIHDHSVQATSIATVVNGSKVEEASIVRPVSLQQRQTRMSFLSKRKPLDTQQRNSVQMNGGSEDPSSPLTPTSRDVTRRSSLFRPQPSSDNSRNQSTDQLGLAEARTGSSKGHPQDEHLPESVPLAKKGSVRKRLSMLKLGVMKGNNRGAMGSLDEE